MISSAPANPKPEDFGSTQEYELKFPLANAQAPALAQWLKACCVPHPEFPETLISSVYYDSVDWRLLNEKVASDYLKSKVRLRWYGPGPDSKGSALSTAPGAFIEAKMKTGSQRTKVRYETGLHGSALECAPLHDGIYEKPLHLLREGGLSGIAGLYPAYQINYRRLRFSHPFSMSILCLDMDIRVARVHHGRFRRSPLGTLPQAVLEQKGPLDRLDPVFPGLNRFALHKGAFSKYMTSYFWIKREI